ncbi:LacI family transcriptional regulator [Brachybacterium phenoliresistens]|uniref:LacI family transcriptional regulator n=1 Tax=Brachybacterium phenoliresistens TaxID=396014 RepID=Z9JVS2_9MICO|nr:LacI family DNA-binding transcriptional regulator [Brachybacterium phenoliresistens]EWS82304.1 LacI family transcriptional regulator [Brachybacterium phenoliresistens]
MTSGHSRVATLADVAARAGVSRATASRVLNGSTRVVAEELRGRVLAAAGELGYVANTAAQAIVRGRSGSIGLLVGAIPDDYFNPIAVGVLNAAQRRQVMVTMAVSGDDHSQAAEIIAGFRAQRAKLLILSGSRRSDGEVRGADPVAEGLAAFSAEGGRVVLIGAHDLPYDCVRVDDHEVGRLMVQRYLELGYRDLTIFAGEQAQGTPGSRRTAGAVAALREAGVELGSDRIIHSPFTRDGGYIAAGEFIRRGRPTRAVLCVADSVALGAMARLRESGIALGTDVAISGVDDLVALRDVTPALTTVKLPWVEVGAKAFELGLDEGADAPREIVMHGHVITRESTPPA